MARVARRVARVNDTRVGAVLTLSADTVCPICAVRAMPVDDALPIRTSCALRPVATHHVRWLALLTSAALMSVMPSLAPLALGLLSIRLLPCRTLSTRLAITGNILCRRTNCTYPVRRVISSLSAFVAASVAWIWSRSRITRRALRAVLAHNIRRRTVQAHTKLAKVRSH